MDKDEIIFTLDWYGIFLTRANGILMKYLPWFADSYRVISLNLSSRNDTQVICICEKINFDTDRMDTICVTIPYEYLLHDEVSGVHKKDLIVL